MKEAALPERLLARLGFAVFEDAGGGALVPVGSLPEWFGRVFGADAAKAGARFVPEERSPFLETFLMDAERVWALDSGERAESGPWIERDPEGNEVALEAEAWVLDGRRILLIGNQQERFDEVSRRLQVARNEKLAHERLRREIQTKEVLLHCIVHDLSQPLTALRGCLSLLSMNLPPEKLREVVDIADRQTRKQEGMIRDVLKAFSSEMAALQAVGAGQTVDLAQGAREVAKEYAAAFSSQGAELALDARLEEPRDWRVTGEPDRLRRMFTNFLENALRYSPAGTVVTVGAEEDGGFLRAFVDDQGPGLPEGVTAAKLFRLFGKGEESTGKAGLGLYFCKITAERWGGGVGCENRAGGGTRFWFRLPRAQGAPAAAQAAAQRPHAAEPSGGKPSRELRVLIADDIEVNRTIAAELLASRGHKVVAVDDGEPAVAAFRAQPFDVVLLDVEMNSMGGLDAARAIRKIERERGSHARILAMTAHDTAKDLEDCRQSGMDGRVVKPIDVETFFRDVEEVAAETAASQTAAPAPAAGGFQERLLARCGGDAALAAKLARIFLKDSPRLMAGVKRAVGEKDSAELASAAHALKGAVGHFGAQEAREAALRLEQMGKSGELDGVKKTLATLETEIELLCQELEVSARGRSSGKQGK